MPRQMSSTRLSLLIGAFVSMIVYWLYSNIDRQTNYEKLYPNLYNSSTQKWVYPKHFMNITRHILKPDEWVERVDAREELYEMTHFWNTLSIVWLQHEYSSQEDLNLSGGPVADQIKCGKDLAWIINNLKQMPDPSLETGIVGLELTRYLDTFGRPEPALHWAGALNWFGSYQKCLQASLDNENIRTRYCLGHFRYPTWPELETIRPKDKIKIGLCLPEACDTLAFDRYKDEIEFLAKYELNDVFRKDLVFDSMYCLPDERSSIRKIPLAGRLTIIILLTWFSIILILSYLKMKDENKLPKHEKLGPSRWAQICDTLTLQSSLRFLTSYPMNNDNNNTKPTIELKPLNFIKVILSFLVIYGHTNSESNFRMRTNMARLLHGKKFATRICLTFGNLMTTYFVFFGLLSSLSLLKVFRINQLIKLMTLIKINLPLVVRVVPLYMLIHFINQTIVPYMGSGPVWDYGTGVSKRRDCFNAPWWQSIPYFAIGQDQVAPACNPPGWFIVSYLQIAPLVPIITYILVNIRNIWARLIFTGFLVSISIMNAMIRLMQQNVIGLDGLSFFRGFVVLVVDKFEPSAYQDTLGRLGSVAVGCLIGILLQEYGLRDMKNIGRKHKTLEGVTKNLWPNWLIGRTMCFLVILGHFALLLMLTLGRVVEKDLKFFDFIVIYALNEISWFILNALLIIQIASASSNVLIRFMNHPFWHSFNKLSLVIYLIHLEIVSYANQVHENAPSVYGHFLDMLKIYCFTIWTSVFAGLILYLFIEAPLAQLARNILFKPKEILQTEALSTPEIVDEGASPIIKNKTN